MQKVIAVFGGVRRLQDFLLFFTGTSIHRAHVRTTLFRAPRCHYVDLWHLKPILHLSSWLAFKALPRTFFQWRTALVNSQPDKDKFRSETEKAITNTKKKNNDVPWLGAFACGG